MQPYEEGWVKDRLQHHIDTKVRVLKARSIGASYFEASPLLFLDLANKELKSWKSFMEGLRGNLPRTKR